MMIIIITKLGEGGRPRDGYIFEDTSEVGGIRVQNHP